MSQKINVSNVEKQQNVNVENKQTVTVSIEQTGKSPYVGENGNWFQYDDKQSLFVDTGVKAQGEPGEQGVQGEPGYTPVKGEDYFTEEDIESLGIAKQSDIDDINKTLGDIGTILATLTTPDESHTHIIEETLIPAPEEKTKDYCYEILNTCTVDGCDFESIDKVPHEYKINDSTFYTIYTCNKCGFEYTDYKVPV